MICIERHVLDYRGVADIGEASVVAIIEDFLRWEDSTGFELTMKRVQKHLNENAVTSERLVIVIGRGYSSRTGAPALAIFTNVRDQLPKSDDRFLLEFTNELPQEFTIPEESD